VARHRITEELFYNKAMKKHQSKRRWLTEHFNDPYVKQAQKQGYRSRAVYKLIEINERDRLLRQNMTVVDLGAAPGGWSQIAVRAVGRQGRVIATDILAMDPIEGVEFIQGDFREDAVLEQLRASIGDRGVDLVISDMAPNISGMGAVDQPRSMYLVELAVDLAQNVLSEDGDLLVKVFQGEGFDELIRSLRKDFRKVLIRKPKASRPRSNEVYVLGRGYLSN
jgi:23S rRNA (uridine2552-2'-O)-methyltransferase